MNYKNFEVAIVSGNGLKFIEVTACDIAAAQADVREAYGVDVGLVSTTLL